MKVQFRPDVRGVYSGKSGKIVDYIGQEGVHPAKQYFCFDFEPGEGANAEFEDPWQLRSEFLLEEDSDPLDGFTLVYGRFGKGDTDFLIPSEKIEENAHDIHGLQVRREEYQEWRSLIIAAMRTPMGKWEKLKARFPARKVELLRRPMALTLEWKDGRPTGIIDCSGILEALIATLQVDELIGAEYRFCACQGCRNTFKVKRRDQRYCSEECKHRQVVRDGRDRNPDKKRIGGRHGAQKTR